MAFDYFSMGMGMLTSAINSYSQVQAIKQQSAIQINAIYNQMEMDQQANNLSALQAEVYAEYSRLIGAMEERNFRQSIDRLRGEQRAQYSKAGVTMSGSALDVLADTTMQGERDALAIRYGAEIKANNYGIQAANEAMSRYSSTMSTINSIASSNAGNSSNWLSGLGGIASAIANAYTPTRDPYSQAPAPVESRTSGMSY
jgi:hypothetical protein